MRRVMTTVLLAALSLPASALIVGCDEKLAEEKTVETKSDGTQVKQEKKVTESPNGTITKTEEKSVDHP